MSRWIRNAGLVLMPALLLSVALLGCSGGDGKKGEKKGDEKKGDETPAGAMKKVSVGKGTIAGTIKLKEGVEPDYDELNAELKKKIDAKPEYKTACKEAYKQTAWLVGKDRGVKNVAVWLMPEKEDEFFDVKDLADKKKGFEPEVYLDQPHCHFDPRVTVFFPGYVNPDNPGSADSPKYVKSGQKFYALNPEMTIQHNTKLSLPDPRGGRDVNQVIGYATKAKLEKAIPLIEEGKLKPYDLSQGPIRISCNIHDWMEAFAWPLPHPLGTTTDEKGNYKIENVPDSGKVRIFVWHEKAGFINKDGKKGQVIDAKDAKQDFTITKTTKE